MTTSEEVEDMVDAWHRDPTTKAIHEFLGWTWEQYARWVETNQVPGCVITTEHLAVMESNACQECGAPVE